MKQPFERHRRFEEPAFGLPRHTVGNDFWRNIIELAYANYRAREVIVPVLPNPTVRLLRKGAQQPICEPCAMSNSSGTAAKISKEFVSFFCRPNFRIFGKS